MIRVALRRIVILLQSDRTPAESKDYLRRRLLQNPKLERARRLKAWKIREKHWKGGK